jgi:RNA polymerase sigma factor (sigma-70 family)
MDQPDAKASFLAAYDTYADDIFRFIAMKVSDRERAADLTQDTYMRYWQTVREGTVVQNDRAFLYRLARNLVIDWYRRKKEASLDALQEEGIDFAGEGIEDVEQLAQMNEAMAIVNALDEASREAVTLRFIEGWSPREIAALTGESANAVSVRINRAMKKIQERIHAPGHDHT